MTAVHLDTSFLIRALVAGSPEDGRLRAWLMEETPVGISVVAWAEFLCGPLTDTDHETARALVGAPVPLDEGCAELAASMFNTAGRRRRTFVDCLVAASAVKAGAHLATADADDFRALTGAGLELA